MPVKSDNPQEVGQHVFERAGLGIAPFRFVGFSTMKYQACPDAPVQPGTSCDYCGTGIMYVCQIKSADGRTFKVGCDCVNKTGEAGLIKAYKQSAEYRKHQRDLRRAKAAVKFQELTELLNRPEVQAALSSSPHPNSYHADQDKTFLDYAQWMYRHAGDSGRADVLKYIRHRLADRA